MINIKTEKDLKIMAQGGKILAKILSQLVDKAQPGVSTLDIDQEAERLILASGGRPSFKMVPGYHFSTCLCVNDVVVHGLPTDYKFKKGDILGIDIGIFYKDFHTDMAQTVIVGNQKSGDSGKQFLKAGEEALKEAIKVARVGNHVGDISYIIQESIEGAGYHTVRVLVGHGVGRNLHEDPQIPGFIDRPIDQTPLLKKGMTLAIEVIYNMGDSDVVYSDDGWTIATKDGSLSGLFEKTIAITNEEPIVLTA